MATVSDFFFAPYETPSQQRRRAAVESGLYHGSRIEPRDPLPGEPVTLAFTTNTAVPIEHVALYYTSDGSIPEGARGQARHGTVMFAEPGDMAHDGELWV